MYTRTKMRDLVLISHILIGITILILSSIILLELKRKKSSWLKPLAVGNAFLNWLLLLPAGALYIIFYPATKTLIKASSWPWAHSVVMETKEHWGLLLPIIATVAAMLVISGRKNESKKYWILVIILVILMGIMGRIIKIGALA